MNSDDDDVMTERGSVSQVFHWHSKQNSEYPVKDHCGVQFHDISNNTNFCFSKRISTGGSYLQKYKNLMQDNNHNMIHILSNSHVFFRTVSSLVYVYSYCIWDHAVSSTGLFVYIGIFVWRAESSTVSTDNN